MEAGVEGESPAAASASFTSDADDVMDTSVTSVSEDQGEKAVDYNEVTRDMFSINLKSKMYLYAVTINE